MRISYLYGPMVCVVIGCGTEGADEATAIFEDERFQAAYQEQLSGSGKKCELSPDDDGDHHDLEGEWTVQGCVYLASEQSILEGEDCAASVFSFYDQNDDGLMKQKNAGPNAQGDGTVYLTSGVSPTGQQITTAWIRNQSSGNGCAVETAVAIRFVLDNGVWGGCAFTAVLEHNGAATCPAEEWWASGFLLLH